jgi:hypothetical protein
MSNLFSLVARCAVILAVLVVFLLNPSLSYAQGVLTIFPKRVELDMRQRTFTVSVANASAEVARYRVELIDKVMSPEGRVDNLPEGQTYDRTAAPFVRYSPRTIELRPGETQAIRIIARRDIDMVDGEYRTFLNVRELPREGGVSVDEALQPGEISVRIVPLFNIAIPIILRSGSLSFQSTLENVRRESRDIDGQQVDGIAATLTRSGDRSAYGNLYVLMADPENPGRDLVVGGLFGVAVYPELTSRQVFVPMRMPNNAAVPANTPLRFRYNPFSEDSGRFIPTARPITEASVP